MAWRNRLTGLLIFFTVGCTPMMYGVPLETWETLNEAQRLETINGYNQRQLARQKARAEAAKARAAALELQRQREAEEARLRQLRVDAVYRGEGHYGDLLRVTIRGGDLNFSGKQRPYGSLSFKIAEGEIKKLQVSGDKHRRATLVVSYLDGTLVIDDPSAGSSRRRGIHLGYDPSWGHGKSYAGVVSNGPLRLRGAEVAIQIASEHPPVAEEVQPQIIIVQQPTPPQTIIVKERPRQRPDQRVVVVNNPPAAVVPPPQIVVTRPEPPKTIIVREPRRNSPHQQVVVVPPSPKSEEDHRHPDKVRHSEDAKSEGNHTENDRNDAEEKRNLSGKEAHKFDRKVARDDREKKGDDQRRASVGEKPLKVTLQIKGNGKGRQKNLSPIVFAIRAGETLQIPMERERGAEKTLLVGYQDGVLYVDGDPSRQWKKSKATALAYDAGWTRGRSYQVSTEGPARIKGCEIFIQEIL